MKASVSSKATILVVDDEPDVREVLEEYFVAHGYAVIGAENADVARTKAAEHAIDHQHILKRDIRAIVHGDSDVRHACGVAGRDRGDSRHRHGGSR